MELIFKEEDIETLDMMLEYLKKHHGTGFTCKNFVKEKILNENISIYDFNNYAYILSYYCARIDNNSFGDDGYRVFPNEKTANFYYIGGFNQLFSDYKRKEKERVDKEKKEIEKLKWDILNGKWLNKTKWCPFIIAFVSLIISLLSIFIRA